MGAYYDEIEIEDMAWDAEKGVYHYPCPCGDRFEISRRQLAEYEDIATCPSCSLIIRVIYDPVRAWYVIYPSRVLLMIAAFPSWILRTNRMMVMRRRMRRKRAVRRRETVTLRVRRSALRMRWRT